MIDIKYVLNAMSIWHYVISKQSRPDFFNSPGTVCGVDDPAVLWLTQPSKLFLTQDTTDRSMYYKSPARMIRSMNRFVKHLFRTIKMKPKLSLPGPNSIQVLPKVPKLSISPSCLTNYPEPCNVCNQHQCSYNFNHGLIFSLNESLGESLNAILQESFSSLNVALEESFSSANAALKETMSRNWKPPDPDDANG